MIFEPEIDQRAVRDSATDVIIKVRSNLGDIEELSVVATGLAERSLEFLIIFYAPSIEDQENGRPSTWTMHVPSIEQMFRYRGPNGREEKTKILQTMIDGIIAFIKYFWSSRTIILKSDAEEFMQGGGLLSFDIPTNAELAQKSDSLRGKA